jgi:mRNA interferase RelE/StbE
MYKIKFSTNAAKVYLKLPVKLRQKMDTKLQLLAQSPYAANNNVKPLAGMKKCYRLRVGDWRIVYEIVDQVFIIYVIKVAQRQEVYQS